MRKLLIKALLLGLIVSCTTEALDDTVLGEDNVVSKEDFDRYNTVNSAMGGFDKISEQVALNVQKTSKNSTSGCLSIELLISYQENPIPGFSKYDYYNKVVIDANKEQCEFNDWDGELEYYVAGALVSKWKDSTAFKKVQYDEGYVFDGYRVAEKNIELSNETIKVYDVFIDGVITNPSGDSYHYTTARNFIFENRFTSDEVVMLTESSSLEGIDQSFFIRSVSVADSPLVFKVACFDRSTFFEYPVEGLQEFSNSLGDDFTVDYGDGTCDKEIILTTPEGESITFDL